MGLTKFKRNVPAELWCHYCNRLVPKGEESVDHVVPISKGGSNEDTNLVWCCYICNILKSDMEYKEFRWRIKITTEHIEECRLELVSLKLNGRGVGSLPFSRFQRKWAKFQNKIIRYD